MKEYKASNAQKYANTFEKEPEVRPDYVPPKVQRDGQDYDVKYNPTTRSYGYTIPSTGVFMAFDPLDYMAMNSYRNYAAQPPVYVPVQGSSIGTTILTVFLVLIAVLAVVFFLGFIMQRRS